MADTLLTKDTIVNEIIYISPLARSTPKMPKGKMKNISIYRGIVSSPDTPDWVKVSVFGLTKAADRFIEFQVKSSEEVGKPLRLDPPGEFVGNRSVWSIYEKIIGRLETLNPSKEQGYRRSLTLVESSISSAIRRLGYSVDIETKREIQKSERKNTEDMSKLVWATQCLREAHSSSLAQASGIFQTHSGKAKRKGKYKEKVDACSRRVEGLGIEAYSISSLTFLKIEKEVHTLTPPHFQRLVRMLEGALAITSLSQDLGTKYRGLSLVSSIIDSVSDLVEEDVDFLGEVLKAARTWYLTKLDSSPMFSRDPSLEYLKALKPERRMWVRIIGPRFRRLCTSVESTINLLSMYKSIPHPDTSLSDVFATLTGLKSPNRSDPSVRSRFKGTLRRALYASMKMSGHDVRLASTDSTGDTLAEKANAARLDVGLVRGMGFGSWSSVKFENVRSVPDIESMEVPHSSKASQDVCDWVEDDLLEAKNFSIRGSGKKPGIIKQAGTINDSVSKLKGISKMKSGKAIKRFEEIIKLHQEFEECYPGLLPEDIPSDELERFLMSNPSARYLVGTEPKFGETHKKVTRMFYMAEQELKVMTQKVERLAKTLSRRQPGVSIVKSYAGRRKDLESFCHSTTGEVEGDKSVFVSFDMSEFSKKFPMDLVRAYGEVLSEITGVDWLKRLDLFFRASVVIHNSRGFFDFITGVKGGFEGFLNFVWSSIHATIMEIALEATGLSGNLLTFSDDGLLLFYVPQEMTGDQAMKKVLTIKSIYSMFGLEFHLGKTLISTNVWEYLGDISVNGRILPTWMKEGLSMNRVDISTGVEPLYSRIRSIDAQQHALLAAGGPPIPSYILKRIFCAMSLYRLGVEISPATEEFLFILPSSCGGLRITSPGEDVAISTIQRDSEVVADIELLLRDHPLETKSVLKELLSRRRKSRDPLGAIVSATCFVTDHPDTSGMGVLNDAIDIIKDTCDTPGEVVSNPIKKELGRKLLSVIKHVENLDPNIISDLIYSTPAWKEYTDSLSLVRGRGAIRLIPRRKIRELQGRDTWNVSNSLYQWEKCIRDGITTKSSVMEVVTALTMTAYRGLSIRPLRPSPRIVIEAIAKGGNIEVRADPPDTLVEFTAQYSEPSVRFPSDITTISWTSQSGGSLEIRRVREFLSSVSKIIAYSPESLPVIQAISSICGIETPNIPEGLLRAGHRKSSFKASGVDIRTVIPRWFDAISSSRYLGEGAEKVFSYDRADRMTYLTYARSLAYFSWLPRYSRGRRRNRYFYVFPIELSDLMHEHLPMTPKYSMPEKFEVPSVPPEVKREFINSAIEYKQYLERAALIDDSNPRKENLEANDREMIKLLMKNSLVRWIISSIKNHNNSILEESEFPLPLTSIGTIAYDAMIESAWACMSPSLRRKLSDLVLNRSFDGDEDLYEIINSDPFKEFLNQFSSSCYIMSSADVPGVSYDQLESMKLDYHKLLSKISRMLSIKNLLPRGRLVVIRNRNSSEGKMSKSHRIAFREAFTNTISSIYTAASKEGWDMTSAARSLKLNIDLDDSLDFLVVCRNLLRESEHRTVSHPYNRTSALIAIIKFYSCIRHFSEKKYSKVDIDELRQMMIEWRLPRITKIELMSSMARKGKELGSDHTEMLIQGISPEEVSRCIVHLKACRYGNRIGSASKSSYSLRIEESSRMLSSMYSVFISASVANLVEYPSSLESSLIERFTPSSSSTLDIFQIKVDEPTIRAEPIEFGDEVLRKSVIEILREHVSIFCKRSFITGVSVRDDAERLVFESCADHYFDEGTNITGIDSAEPGDSILFALSTDDSESALATYATLASPRDSSVSLFKDTSSGKYMIFGVSEMPTLGYSHRFSELSVNGEDHEGIIPKMTLYQELRMVVAQSRHISSTVGQRAPNSITVAAITAMTRSIGVGSQVNNNSVIVQAVFEILKEGGSHCPKLGCYYAILYWLNGGSNRKGLMEYMKNSHDSFNKMSQSEKVGMLSDAGVALTWVVVSALKGGISLSAEGVRIAKLCIRSFRSNYTVPPSVFGQRIKSLDTVVSESEGRYVQLGCALGFLYSMPEPSSLDVEFEYESSDNELDHIGDFDFNDLREMYGGSGPWYSVE
jgi:hypothetical protein